MAVTGKTGSDAVLKAVKHIVVVLSHYMPKFMSTVAIMEASGALSAADAAAVRAFVASLNELLVAVSKMADYSGF